jgi:hypothetical protein
VPQSAPHLREGRAWALILRDRDCLGEAWIRPILPARRRPGACTQPAAGCRGVGTPGTPRGLSPTPPPHPPPQAPEPRSPRGGD